MKEECRRLVDIMDPNEHRCIFSTTKHSNIRDDYFINSGDKIRFFFEDGAIDSDGNLRVDKQLSLNKIGHALHALCPTFAKVTFSDKIKDVVRRLQFEDPVVVQTMYIFKQPGIGGEVIPHQDASYLTCDPVHIVGLWFALEDADVENGCLSFIPGSHMDGIHGNYRLVRTMEGDHIRCTYEGVKPSYDNEKFVMAPARKGSLVLIHGLVVHQSERNVSTRSRHAFTIHLYDGNCKWSERNWLQPTEANTFTHMFDAKD
jgi:ectoine hydroxylase-related dioxygenase (phytanoyl-CoA dioxygenase family)